MEHRRDFVDRHPGLKVRKNGQQKTCNLSCNIAAKRVVQRCCAFYHQHKTCLAPNQVVNSFCSSVAKHVARFFFPVFPCLYRERRGSGAQRSLFHTFRQWGGRRNGRSCPGGKGLQFCSLFICLSVFFTKSKFLYPMTVESELLKHLTIKIYANLMNFWYFS